MIIPVNPVYPLITIRRTRLLPVDGRVLVRNGQKVSPMDVVAEANPSPEHLILNVARGLGLPPEKVDELFHFKQGDRVSDGAILAGPVGVPRRVVRAPWDARIIFAGDGQIMLAREQQPFELHAGMPGVVVSVVPDRGVVLQNTGGLIQGVWGNKKLDVGIMRVVQDNDSSRISTKELDVNLKGAIIVGGYCNDVELLHSAAELPVRGLILGSMVSSMEALALEMPYPIILIDGFGEFPMNSAGYELLKMNNQREVVINAEGYNRWEGKRPEIVIPIPEQEQLPEPKYSSELSTNQRVKILMGPNQAEVGVLIAIRSKIEMFPSGIKAAAGVVRLKKGETLVVPLANIEILD
jgi:hypothetical protein